MEFITKQKCNEALVVLYWLGAGSWYKDKKNKERKKKKKKKKKKKNKKKKKKKEENEEKIIHNTALSYLKNHTKHQKKI